MHPEKHLATSNVGKRPTIPPITEPPRVQFRKTACGMPDFRRMYGRNWRQRYPSLIKEYSKWRSRLYKKRINSQKAREHYVKYGRTPKRKARRHARRLERDYGMTIEQYEELERKQGGVCAICGRPPTRGKLAVDHCHETNVVRALLCRQCNLAIGNFEEDPERLERAIAYLRATTCPTTGVA